MLYLIGIGLSKESLTIEAIDALKKCKEIFIDVYTTTLPFEIKEYENFLKKVLRKTIRLLVASREILEEKSQHFLELAKNTDVGLLVYGDPLIATTHFSLIKDAKKMGIKTRVIHNASIINGISDIGLSVYKFGKIASMPKWQQGYKPKSFYHIIKQNLAIGAHTLLLISPELSFYEALEQLMHVDRSKKIEKIFVCVKIGTKDAKIFFDKPENLKKLKNQKLIKSIEHPFCFVVPASLEWYEEEELKKMKQNETKWK